MEYIEIIEFEVRITGTTIGLYHLVKFINRIEFEKLRTSRKEKDLDRILQNQRT
jgi:hypothetical protein